MFCNKCGKKLSDDAMFCPECGTKVTEMKVESVETTEQVTEEISAVIETEQTETAAETQQTEVVPEQVSQQSIAVQKQETIQPVIVQTQEAQETVSIPKHKAKSGIGKKVGIAGLAAVVIIGILCTIGFVFFGTTIKAKVMGPKNYYLSLEQNSLRNTFSNLKNSYTESPKKFSYESEVKTKIGGEMLDEDEYTKSIVDSFSKIAFKVKVEGNNEKADDTFARFSFTGLYDKEKIGSIDVASADNKVKISFPDLTEKTIGYKLENKSSDIQKAMLGDEKAFKEAFGLDKEAFNKLLEKYIKDVIFKTIPDENVIFESKAKYQDIACNSITIKINEDVLSEIFKALAEQIKEDEDFKTFYKASIKLAYDMNPEMDKPSSKEIDDLLDTFCDELKDGAKDIDSIDAEYKVYFKDDGTIMARSFEEQESETLLEAAAYKNADKEVVNLKLDVAGDSLFELLNEMTVKDNKQQGSLSLEINKKKVIDADYTRELNSTVNGMAAFVGSVEGILNLELFSGEFITGNDSFKSINFSYDSKKNGDDKLSGELKLSTKVEGKSLTATISTETTHSDDSVDKPNVSIDDSIDASDAAALSDLQYEISDSLTNKLTELLMGIN